MKTINVEYWMDIPDDFTGNVIKESGTKLWLLNGKEHREDGPAIEWANGDKVWHLNGKYYTEDEHKTEMAIRNSSLGKLILKDGYFSLEGI